jgi:diguanylate cyclase (GGDEF)-like protein
MTKLTSLFKRQIITRIVLGYLFALAFTVGIVFLAFNGLNRINDTVEDITNRLTVTRSLAQDIGTQLQRVRYHADRYHRLYQQRDLDQFNVYIGELQQSQNDISRLIIDPDKLKMIQHIQKETLMYMEGFEETARLIMYQQMLLSTSFLKQELSVENQLSAIRINVAIVQLPDIYFSFGNARSAFELMRFHQAKYMSTRDEKFFVLFKQNYQLASRAFSDLITALERVSDSAEMAQNVIKAKNELSAYNESFMSIHAASTSLIKLSKKLEQHEQAVTRTASHVSSVIEEEYKKSNHHTQTLVLNTQLQLFAAVIVAVLINLGLIWVILRNIIAPILEELQNLSNLDSLTSVANRRAFDIGIKREIDRAKQENLPLSILLCDVDFFKAYNDIYGHQQGDECLKTIAKTLSQTCDRPRDFVARYGGEEFIVILPNTNSSDGLCIAKSVILNIEALKLPHEVSSASDYVTLSVGVATMDIGEEYSPHELIRNADNALYEAKRGNRNCVRQCS